LNSASSPSPAAPETSLAAMKALEYFRAAKMASRLNASCEGGGATKKS
jgi:hypothetical protein